MSAIEAGAGAVGAATLPPTPSHIPGEAGAWVFILGDMAFFAYAFVVFMVYRGRSPALFSASQSRLHSEIGLAQTIALLASSFLVVQAVDSVRRGAPSQAARSFSGALIFAAAFVALKVVEYYVQIRGGANPTTNRFFTFYFLLTGLHMLHLLLGAALLAYLRRCCRRGTWTRGRTTLLEAGTCYWHMVDCLWLIIFPLLYLSR